MPHGMAKLWLTMETLIICTLSVLCECETDKASNLIIVGFPDLYAGSQGFWKIQVSRPRYVTLYIPCGRPVLF